MRLLKEPTRRIRFLTQDQAAALLRELPRHLRDMAIFALSTGLRAANITGLCWGQVDLERKQAWVHPDQAKARRAIAVPLNDTALEVLERQNGIHPVRVFTYGGRARKAGQHDGLVQSAEARRYREIPQARFTAHVGSLACAGRNASACAAGAGWLGDLQRWCGGTRISRSVI